MDCMIRGACTCVLLALTWTTGLLPGVEGHGRLMDPPSRSSMWREGFNNPPNYDDNQLFCGGASVQWEKYGGKCGLCGDPWPGPRDNEPGGKYANGIITKKYQEGQVIEVYVQLTANHKGYFEFRLCKHNNPLTNVTLECLNQHVLIVDATGASRYMVPEGAYSTQQELKIKLRLPAGVVCTACVLQWKYNAGNSWGVDPETKEGCIGCGPQEQFYGCSDVAIGHDEVVTGVVPQRFPWYFQPPDSEWHYGIAYVFGSSVGDSGSISAADTFHRGGGGGVMCTLVVVFALLRSLCDHVVVV